ncbi:MAG: hypothetical protein AAGJ31_05900 [Verrucomicrobiota bacterium]
MNPSTNDFDYRSILGAERRTSLTFSQFLERFLEAPNQTLKTSATMILEAVKHFGVEAVIRSGEPCLRYHIFQDPFSNGINSVFGQEFCIKRIIDVIESVDKESGPRRGIVLVGPPASGKTNMVDLLARALEEYSQETKQKQYSFFFRLANGHGRELELRSPLMPNPILLFPTTLTRPDGSVSRPRQEILDEVQRRHGHDPDFSIPSYYQHATLDKRSLDILETLRQHPRNEGKTLFEIIEEYVRVEEVEYSSARGKGISNIDDMRQLQVQVRPISLAEDDMRLLNDHLQGKYMFRYEGALLSSNRGLLHIHDAFSGDGDRASEMEYKPLLMLLGSGKTSMEFTQASLDTTVFLTTNLEEMNRLDQQLTSSKLLDRIEKVPVNYLLDAASEMDILKRDITNVRERYQVDPNLVRIAAYYSVMTRLFPPQRSSFPPDWSAEKADLYLSIPPEKKLFIYASRSEDPVQTIAQLPPWHPFRNECARLGIDLRDEDVVNQLVVRHPEATSLEESSLFTNEELAIIDDDFMRELYHERYPKEGRYGLSIRQIQNIMRNTIANSDGNKVTVSIFLSQLEKVLQEGPHVHHWLNLDAPQRSSDRLHPRTIGNVILEEGAGNYGDYAGLIQVVKGIYHETLRQEITVSTVDRDPERIEKDLRKYLQHALLDKALENKAFAHVIVPRYTYIDPETGEKVDKPDYEFLRSLEAILLQDATSGEGRKKLAQKFLDLQSEGEINIEESKPVILSRNDNLLAGFNTEYTKLLSHRKTVEGVSPEELRDAFFLRQNNPEQYEKQSAVVRDQVDVIQRNLGDRFDYPEDIALDTVVYALRKEIIDFASIIA